MRLNVDFSELERLANAFNKNQPTFKLQRRSVQFQPIDVDLGGDGIEIDPARIEVTSGLLGVEGRQVLLYIKDHSYGDNFNKALRNGRDGNKFHVAHCQVLERMMTQGRYKRYVATNKINGEFLIQGAQGQTDYAKLWVCQTCLKHLNYKGSRYSNKALQNAKNFNFKEFFSTYSSLFQHSPSYTAEDDVGYADNWADISKQVRENASYLCEKCTVDLNEHPDLCHVHHINGAKQDNSMHNLQVLCADCHRKEHLGHMHVSHSDTQRITTLRRRQNLLSSCSWDQALHLIDPALRDELELFKTEGYPAPHLGYQIIDPLSGKVHIECDAAWPAKREALTLTQAPAIPRWSIYCFGQKLGVQ